LLNVEVGPGGASSVLEVSRGSFYFHANMFKHLVVQQRVDNSSYHREARALQLQVGRVCYMHVHMCGHCMVGWANARMDMCSLAISSVECT
jgi:hypothetical protein